jgi:ComF family protein
MEREREQYFFPALWQGVLSLLFPRHCVLCGESLEPGYLLCLCPACWGGLPRVTQPFCPKCGRPIRGRTAVPFDTACGECRLEERRFRVCRSAGVYEGRLKECVHMLKYEKKRELARTLGLFMAEVVGPEIRGVNYGGIVPVPMHRRRLRERGFNQALLLAQEMGRRTGIPVLRRVLRRSEAHAPQSTLSRAERLESVKGAFELRDEGKVCGKHLLLMDDVFTTGATAEECVRVLLRGGAMAVDIVTLARSI